MKAERFHTPQSLRDSSSNLRENQGKGKMKSYNDDH